MSEPTYELAGKRVWVAGHRGMVGSALVRRLAREDCTMLTAARSNLDLTRQAAVEHWVAAQQPDIIVVAAAKVGGIHANSSYPADFLYDNLAIATNIVYAAHLAGVPRLLFLGSSCVYPRAATQPVVEESLLTGPLEPTNEWYAVAKIAGIKLVESYRRQYGRDYIAATPTNAYGPGDNFDPAQSHVVPALMRRLHEAKQTGQGVMDIWGSGAPLRELMHVDDIADALVYILRCYSDTLHLNVGNGSEVSICALAEIMADVVGWTGQFHFDTSKPDGMPKKLLDSGRLRALGWSGGRSLDEGLKETYDWFLANAGKTLSRKAVA